jgi:metal-dependent amidase/aminoacylase/carboxypeptidase family protein
MPGLHHPCFDFNDAAIPMGIEAFVALATNTGSQKSGG